MKRVSFCQRTGKVSESKNQANQHLKALRRKNGYEGEVFYCTSCRNYHVGSKAKIIFTNS
jgi:hypothetical protein